MAALKSSAGNATLCGECTQRTRLNGKASTDLSESAIRLQVEPSSAGRQSVKDEKGERGSIAAKR
eukprot:6172888-Pleurochrysis_carterae.AAC.1